MFEEDSKLYFKYLIVYYLLLLTINSSISSEMNFSFWTAFIQLKNIGSILLFTNREA